MPARPPAVPTPPAVPPATAADRPVPSRAALTTAQRRVVAELLRVSPVLDELGRRFAAGGHALHLVGGWVRDALLGRTLDDIDLTTDARPERVHEIVAGWADTEWDTGIAFGTVGVRKGGLRLEITTYRSEHYEPGSRNPSVTYGDSLEADLVRRDFTVNAMAVSVPGHDFVDPHGGLADLAAGVLRTPAAPAEAFADDPLRMLRAARFAAQLRFSVDPGVVAAMAAMAPRLSIVSVERVQGELTKLLLGADPRRGLELLVDTGLADLVLPEVRKLQLTVDPVHRHKDVYQHSLTVLENAIALEDGEPDLTLRLAALLHDIGKPKTRAFEPNGGVSFHHHEVVGAQLTRARLGALRYPKALIDDVSRLVELHLRFHGYGSGEWTDAAVRRYVTDAGRLLPRLHKLVRSDCTTRNQRKAAALAAAYDSLESRIARLAEQEELARIRPDLDGHAVARILGVPPGPVIGRARRHLLDLRMERGPLGEQAATEELLAWAREQGLSRPDGEPSGTAAGN